MSTTTLLEDQIAAEREREELRAVVASFLTRAQPLEAVRRSIEQGHDPQVWRRLSGELGLTGVGLPEGVGGTGESVADLVAVTEELGRGLDPGPYLTTAVLGARLLVAAGADPALVERVVAGTTIASVAVPSASEPLLAGYLTDEGVVVDGTVRHVLHGGAADVVVVVAELSEGPTLVLLETAAEGVEVEPLPVVDPTRPLADLRLQGARGAVLGPAGSAHEVLDPVLRVARIALAAELVGVAQGALDLTVAHALEREQFGRPIGSFQSIKHLLVDVMMGIEASRTAVRRAADAVDAVDPEARALAHLTKAVAADAAVAAGTAAVQVHGAIGFTWEHDAHLFLKRALSGARLLGSARDQRQHLAALLLDGPTTPASAGDEE